MSSDEAGVTTNSLRLASVPRALADKVVTCEAANTELGLPRHAALQLDLLTAPTHLNLSCAVAGAAVAAPGSILPAPLLCATHGRKMR